MDAHLNALFFFSSVHLAGEERGKKLQMAEKCVEVSPFFFVHIIR